MSLSPGESPSGNPRHQNSESQVELSQKSVSLDKQPHCLDVIVVVLVVIDVAAGRRERRDLSVSLCGLRLSLCKWQVSQWQVSHCLLMKKYQPGPRTTWLSIICCCCCCCCNHSRCDALIGLIVIDNGNKRVVMHIHATHEMNVNATHGMCCHAAIKTIQCTVGTTPVAAYTSKRMNLPFGTVVTFNKLAMDNNR